MLKLKVIKGNAYIDSLKKLLHDDNIMVEHNPNGYPIIKDSKYYLSISHSNNMTLIAVSSRPVGVDMELIKDYDHRLLKLLNLPLLSNYNFFKEWTRREALIKRDNLKLGNIIDMKITGLKFITFRLNGYVISILN